MIHKLPSYKIVCDICGKEDTNLPECYTVFSHMNNHGWDKHLEELDLRTRPDYTDSDFHICPKCSPLIFDFLCVQRRKKWSQ